MLSPQPPQIHSWFKFLGRRALEQPHDESWPSRQAREMEWTTPAAAIEWAKAASRLPGYQSVGVRCNQRRKQQQKQKKRKKIVIIIKFNHRLVVVAREGEIPSFLSETISRMQMSGRRPSFVTNGVSKSKKSAYDLGSCSSSLAAELGHSRLIVSDFHWTNHTRLLPNYSASISMLIPMMAQW